LYSVGSRQGLSPVLDVCRDARWGRTEETFGEDPYLCALMATAYVKGLQNENHPQLATLKHFCGHAFSEGGRNHAPVRIGRKEFNDLFLYPFEMAVKHGRAGSVMPAYHDLDGEPFHQSKEYINDQLREKWNFDGIVVSDYEGLQQLVDDHRTQPDSAHAAAASIRAGMDVELPGNRLFTEGIAKAVDKGLLDMADVDEAVTRHLIEKYRLGLFDNPYTDEGAITLQTEEHLDLALRGAEESMVLLENDGVLPLRGDEKLALIGPLADNPMGMMGGYAFPVHLILSEKREGDSQIKTLRSALSGEYGDKLIYAEGCRVLTGRPEEAVVFPGDVVMDGSVQTDYVSYDESGIPAALNAAEKADKVVIAVGDLAGLFLSGTVGEGSDASSLELPGVQQKLIDKVLALGKPTVIVVYSGRPYHLGSGFKYASAVLQAWLPGQGGADGTVNILKGRTNPGGKLPLSIPRTVGAMPYFYNH
ncbi:MAG: glycoside hydrolase family 3 N-terminal domain-containing protein, partial [Spirochaetales bacterium]|nr:glycoside hydrolase family 3 N-terminal domain-containing protein [Spirochaetales bacterium]